MITARFTADIELTEEEWRLNREYVGRQILGAMGPALNRPPHHNLSFDHQAAQNAADIAMEVLGFKKSQP